jgi:hypothetical protein
MSIYERDKQFDISGAMGAMGANGAMAPPSISPTFSSSFNMEFFCLIGDKKDRFFV